MNGTNSNLPRRRVLAAAAALGVAGCLGGEDDEDGTEERTPADGTTDPGDGSTETVGEGDEAGEDDETDDWEPAEGSPLEASLEPEVVAEGLEIPWDVAFADDGTIHLTERTGRVVRLDGDEVEEVVTLADVDTTAHAGPLGLTFHPTETDLLYIYYTAKSGSDSVNRVARYDLASDDPDASAEVVVDDIPAGTIHNGGRIRFGPEGDLWIPTGDTDRAGLARDPESLAGKVLRVTPDGEPAEANPDDPEADPRIYTRGHRNPQGLAFLPDGTPVITEHGPSARDEVNLLRAGGDYGWPDARDGEEYPDSEYDRPVVNTGPDETWAPSGAAFYTGDEIPVWRNRLLVSGLFSQRLTIVTLTDDESTAPTDEEGTFYDEEWMDDRYVATAHHTLEDVLGRLRHVAQGPDGGLYVLTSNRDGAAQGEFPKERDDVLVRLRPA